MAECFYPKITIFEKALIVYIIKKFRPRRCVSGFSSLSAGGAEPTSLELTFWISGIWYSLYICHWEFDIPRMLNLEL